MSCNSNYLNIYAVRSQAIRTDQRRFVHLQNTFNQFVIMHRFVVCGLFSILLLMPVTTGMSREPQNGDRGCSKFYYEHELLEKSVRLTLKREELDKVVKQLKDSLKTITFSAKQLSDTTLDTNQVMVFTEIITNQGSGYNANTGMFTAPVAGTYLFTVHLCVYKMKSLFYSIVVDGKDAVNGYNYDKDNNPCSTVTATVTLQPSQRVWVKCTSGTTQLYQSSNFWNVFTGVMVHGEV